MKKIIHSLGTKSASVGLAALLLLGSAGTANAQTSSDLQAQISALLAQIAQLQAQMGGGAQASASFARDLTLGSQGADVTQLQNFLISKGFSVPAGATGFFGAQTKAALAAFQAANGISPAAGYFGPTTRARVNAMIVVVPPPSNNDTGGNNGNTDTSGTLSGGEATIRSFDLIEGEDLSEGDSNQEVASASFDIRGGDIRVQRVTLEFTGQDSDLSIQPWRYLDTLAVYNGSKKVGSVDAGSKGDWDKNGDTYSIDIAVNSIMKMGNGAELSIRADAQSNIDTKYQDQTFEIMIPDNGIRAVDAKSINVFFGKETDTVTLGFAAAESGDLSIRESSDNPDAGVIVAATGATSAKADVLEFEIRNKNDADSILSQLTFRVNAAFAGSSVSGEDVSDLIRRATLTLDGKSYVGTVSGTDQDSYEGSITFKNLKTTVEGDDTIEGTLTIELFGSDRRYDPGATLSFDLLATDVDAEGDESGDTSDVSGTVSGNTMTISTDAGVSVAGKSTNAALTYNSNTTSASYGTLTMKFDVTATGDDIYVPKTVTFDDAPSSTAGVHVVSTADTFAGVDSQSLISTADSYNADFYVVREGDTETFTVTAVLNPDAAGTYQLGLDYVRFSATSTDFNGLQTLDVDQNKAQFRTDTLYIPN